MPYSKLTKRRAESKSHRLRKLLQQLHGGPTKSQRLYFVTLGSQTYKRIVLPDTASAKTLEDRLEQLGLCKLFPTLLCRHENELWVEYISGTTPSPNAPETVPALARFYAGLYAHTQYLLPLEETRLLLRLRRDLDFLRQIKIIDKETHDRLWALAEQHAPPTIIMGFDYLDAVIKNFISTNDTTTLCAVDIESLKSQTPLGAGVAKASYHWMGAQDNAFWGAFNAIAGTPKIEAQYPLVELCAMAHWTKTKVLTGKSGSRLPEQFQHLTIQVQQ